jgi:dienelactone hydrolase
MVQGGSLGSGDLAPLGSGQNPTGCIEMPAAQLARACRRVRSLSKILRAALLVLALACAMPVPAQHASAASRTETMELDGRSVAVDVYPSIEAASVGVAIVAHGFARARVRHRDLARALAAAGVTAVVPDLPHVMDHWGNGDAIVELARTIEHGALGMPPIERSRIVLVGTSAGGLASVLAAAKLPGIAGWVGLDPVDRTGTGKRAASKLESPAVVLLAEPSGCNLFGSGRSIAHAAPHLLRAELLRGASHCDFESPTNKLCSVMCGESSPTMQALARDEAVIAVLEILAPEGLPARLSDPAAPAE